MSPLLESEEQFERTRQRLGFFLGLGMFFLVLFLPVPETFIELAQKSTQTTERTEQVLELARGTKSTSALALLMIIWWITEAIPIPATSLLPGIMLPLLHVTGFSGGGAFEFIPQHVFANYAHPVIFLFLGGFLIAAAMQKWGLDKRLTLWILSRGRLANNTRGVIFGLMAVTAFISMWISNTATAAMMLPLALGVLSLSGVTPGKSKYGTALMLGIAYAASIGGIGTIIGTPPNGIAISILEKSGLGKISFLDWMKFGIPYVIIAIPCAWYLLIRRFPPEVQSISGGKEILLRQLRELGTLSAGEKATITAFGFAVVLWTSNPFCSYLLPATVAGQLSWVDEYSIALMAALLLFLIPVDRKKGNFALSWRDAKFVDWGTLILFGGGIALSDAMFKTGLASWIATAAVGILGTPSTFVLVVVVVFLMVILTEIASNTAATTMMVPIVIAIARGTGDDPVALAVSAAVAASMGFMLPVATPPNALVYGTGYVKIRDMVRMGFLLDITGWILTVIIIYFFGHTVFGLFAF
ncbi:MAG: DASS family sodium-coupled anion symporter [Bacteroidota bacterium]